MWGRERAKVEESVEKLSQKCIIFKFPQNFYNWGKLLAQKYVINGLPAI